MKRTAIQRRTRLQNVKPIRRQTRLKPVNSARKAKRFERDFGSKRVWIVAMPCVAACSAPAPSDPHHVKTRASGGTKRDLVPLCRKHHNLFHSVGSAATFERETGVDLRAEADRFEAEWQERQAA